MTTNSSSTVCSLKNNECGIQWQKKIHTHCTMGRGGVETKVNKGTCYWVWNPSDKILACMKKDPSCFRKHLEQCFLRPDLNFFLEFQKNFWFAISVNLKMTIQNYFFVKNVCKKKSPIKFVGNFLTQKEHIRAHPNEYEIYVEKYFLVWKKKPNYYSKQPE